MALWKFLTLLTVGIALLLETRPAYGLAYLGLALFFVLQHWQSKAAEQLVVKRLGQAYSLFPGEQGQLSLQVQNPSRFAFAWVSALDKIPRNLVTGAHGQKYVFSLSPRSTHKVTYQLTARERGVYRLGPIEVFVGDFLGISTQKFQIDDTKTVVVYPDILQLVDLALPSQLSFGNFKALQRISPDPTRLAGVRPYQQGDPLRTIHWPATARVHTLQVKQFDHTVTTTCVVFLDFYKADYEVGSFYLATELAVSTAATLAAHLIRSGESCGLLANAVLTEYLPGETGLSLGGGIIQIPARQGTGQLTNLLTLLAGVKTQEEVDFTTLTSQHVHKLEFGSILLWVVPQDTPEIMTQARNLVHKGHQVQIFVVGKVLHTQLLHQPPGASLQIFAVTREGGISP